MKTQAFLIGVLMCAAYATAEALPKPAVDLPPEKSGNPARAVLAGGCFWCTEAVIRQIDGIHEVVSGYAGGTEETANYQAVCSGDTDHAEAIQITYDPSKITFGELMQILFTSIDPTQKDRQGNDSGRQYRSAIFYENEDQKRVAEGYIKQLNDAKIYDRPIATTVEPLPRFYPAEKYHQNYAELNPNQPYIVQCSLPKVRKIREAFKDRLKSTTKPAK
jgi:peptide-methionine (S)-S-oxide reductase